MRRREAILRAEGEKKSTILVAEGQKESADPGSGSRETGSHPACRGREGKDDQRGRRSCRGNSESYSRPMQTVSDS